MARVLLIDKQELFRHSFKSLIESEYENEVVLGTSTFGDAKEKLFPGMADLLIADIHKLEKEEWLDFEDIIHDHPALKLMVVSDEISRTLLSKLMELKVRAYFSKLAEPNSILSAIKTISTEDINHDLKLGPNVRSELTLNSIKWSTDFENNKDVLTRRELEILELVKKEYSSQRIAEELQIGLRTVESHRRKMIAKTGSKTMIGVIVFANERRISL
mgnify:CR=1 FL=1